MSESNADTVRRCFEGWNRSDWESVERLCWPDIVGVAPSQWPEAEDMLGWPAFRRQMERLKDSWVQESAELQSVQEVSGDAVFVRWRWIARGDASGIELDIEFWGIWRFHTGKVKRVEFYSNREEATAAAGL